MRNPDHITNITDQTTKLDDSVNISTSGTEGKKSAWADWWKKKKENNQKLHLAAEAGELKELKDLLDKALHLDLIPDVNSTGLD